MFIQKLKNVLHYFNALLAAAYYGFPGKKIKVIGITGTDGKTTTTHLTHHILKTAGKKASLVSSVYAEVGGRKYDTGFHVTTPNPWMLQKLFKQAIKVGDEYIVLEVTSHGIDQNRIAFIDFYIALITNVTHEHLDYHRTYEHYLYTKEKLLKRAEIAILNEDDESFQFLGSRLGGNFKTYGIKQKADITPQKFSFTSPLPGEYNRYNCLAAIAIVIQLSISEETIKKALKTFVSVKGRFEKIPNKFGFEIIIDFAHTPNAIKQILSTIKPTVKGKLIHLFGSAGLRDFTKRPLMGEISSAYSNLLILTEEDYRTERLEQIITEIGSGARKAGAKEYSEVQFKAARQSESPVFFKIPDREAAITFAITKLAQKGDTVILTGKAHEKSLARKGVEYPWSEHQAVENALKLREKN